MTIRAFTFAALAVVSVSSSAFAGERIDFTPPLFRELARPTAAVRLASEATTTPILVRTASEAPRRVVEATAR